MGTRAYWLRSGYRVWMDDRWAHVASLADVREEVGVLMIGQTAKVQKWDQRAEHYKPYGVARKTEAGAVITRGL